MKTIILSISDSDKHFSSAISEYTKRLWKTVKIQNIKPTKHGSQSQIITKDTESIISILSKKYTSHFKILLSKDAKSLDTFAFKKLCSWYSDIVFLIWGPYGLDEKILEKYIDSKISFGQMTMPHGLAKLVLLEQIYRIWTIQSGKKYHY